MLKLGEPHLSATMSLMQSNGLDPALVSDTIKNGEATLQLTRMIIENETKGKVKRQLKSICKINGKLVTLKTLKLIVTPLIAIVDAGAAGAALKDPKARMAIIDTGIKATILSRAQEAKREYRKSRQKRERIEKELANRVLPSSFSSGLDDSDTEMIQHWQDEIDEYEARMNSFQDSILSSGGTASLLKDDEMDLDGGEDESISGNVSFKGTLNRFASSSWTSDATKDYEVISINDSYYSCLLDLRDGVKRLDDQLIAAYASCDVLSSLSTTESVAYALERSRNYLYDVANGDEKIARATEKSHELVNQLEVALNACNKFMANDPNGLVATLERMRKSIFLSVEDIDVIIADWGALCRKHGINPFSLPSLQRSLRQELDGNVEAKLALPKARKAEDEALLEFKEACKIVSQERVIVASKLSTSVTERIKSLGMEGSTFLVDLETNLHKCTDSAGFSENSILGLDAASFLILHRQVANGANNEGMLTPSSKTKNDERGGKLDVVGSSGEKARILLAIETDLPGSIGACCNKPSTDVISYSQVAPVAVVYDEIDAHVGGRAAVALAKLLSDQTRELSSDRSTRAQIISITHNPAVAAVADRHMVIQKLPMGSSLDGRVEVLAKSVVGAERREELARMAAGDLAGDEGLRFAEALLREANLHRTTSAEN